MTTQNKVKVERSLTEILEQLDQKTQSEWSVFFEEEHHKDVAVVRVEESSGLRFVCLDLAFLDSPLRTRLIEYYDLLIDLVQKCKKIRTAFLSSHLDVTQQQLFRLTTHLVTFHYDLFNQVLDLDTLSDRLIHLIENDADVSLSENQTQLSRAPRLWKKGPLRHPDKVIKSYRDEFRHLIQEVQRIGLSREHLVSLKSNLDSALDDVSGLASLSLADFRVLKYLFGPKLWLHAHYLDHLQNIYYFLKQQGQFPLSPGTRKFFCFLQDCVSGTLLNGMLVNQNLELHPGYQEHVFIHHNLHAKLAGTFPPKISMLLHSFALDTFSPTIHTITVFPLAIMYLIFMSHTQRGLLVLEEHKSPVFSQGIPSGFIYQPLLSIFSSPGFLSHWRSVRNSICRHQP